MRAYLQPRFVITNQEFEMTVLERFGFTFSVELATLQTSPLEFHIDGLFPTMAWQDKADDVRKGKRTRDVNLILNVLCSDGVIPSGTYLLRKSVPSVSGPPWTCSLRIGGVLC